MAESWEGNDLSSWQPQIDYDAASVGKAFVIVRGGDGYYVDRKTEQHVRGYLGKVKAINPYHYLRYELDPDTMVDQCLYTYERCLSAGMRTGSRFWADVEDTDTGVDWTPAQRLDWLGEVLGLLDAEGIPKAGIYTAPWYWDSRMGGSMQFKDRLLWSARYPLDKVRVTSSADVAGYAIPHIDEWEAAIWQYSGTGMVAGIPPQGVPAYADMDVAYEWVFEEGAQVPDTDWEKVNLQARVDIATRVSASLGDLGSLGDVMKALLDEVLADQCLAALAGIDKAKVGMQILLTSLDDIKAHMDFWHWSDQP